MNKLTRNFPSVYQKPSETTFEEVAKQDYEFMFRLKTKIFTSATSIGNTI